MATREAYEEWIDEVAIEVSCDDAWRDRLFSSPLGEELYVGCERPEKGTRKNRLLDQVCVLLNFQVYIFR